MATATTRSLSNMIVSKFEKKIFLLLTVKKLNLDPEQFMRMFILKFFEHAKRYYY